MTSKLAKLFYWWNASLKKRDKWLNEFINYLHCWIHCTYSCSTPPRSSGLKFPCQIMAGYLLADVDMRVLVSVLDRIECEGESAGSWCWNEQDWCAHSRRHRIRPRLVWIELPGLFSVGQPCSTVPFTSLCCTGGHYRGQWSSFSHTQMHRRAGRRTRMHNTHCCRADLCRGLN